MPPKTPTKGIDELLHERSETLQRRRTLVESRVAEHMVTHADQFATQLHPLPGAASELSPPMDVPALWPCAQPNVFSPFGQGL